MWLRENIRNNIKVCSEESVIVWARFWKMVITWFWKDKYNRPTILYKCDCWKEWFTYMFNITHWKSSCWCDQYENNRIQAYKHWMWWTRENWRWNSRDERFYSCFYNIKRRTNPAHKYTEKDANYKWIKCLWNSFDEFKTDMYDSYIEHCEQYWIKNTTIDRIDSSWDYCKENCRWATIQEQSYNKRQNIIVEDSWKKYCAKEIYNIKKPPISYSSFVRRLKKWFSLDNSLLSKEGFKLKKLK